MLYDHIVLYDLSCTGHSISEDQVEVEVSVRKAGKPRLGVLLVCLIAPQKPVLESDPEPVAFPMCLQEPSGASLEIKRTSFASCRFFFPPLLARSLTERHKHSLKMKATKINSNQPCVKTFM